MPRRPGHRPMTFTGCWTCKSRKIRCDKRPIVCENCEKRGIECAGYGIRLQWISDSLGQAEALSKSQGRIRLKLDETGDVYGSEGVDSLLLNVESCSNSELPLTQGPFSVFASSSRDTRLTDDAMPSPGSCSPNPVPPVAGSVNSCLEPSSVRDVFQDGTPREVPRPSDVSLSWLSDLATLPSPLATDLDPSLAGLNHFFDTAPDPINTPSQGNTETQQVMIRPGLDLSTKRCHLPKTIHIDLFGNTEIDNLMSHYNKHVTGLLVPIDHSANPYRNLYLSTALKGVACLNLEMTPLSSAVYSALSNSLIATSAFHIWNHNRDLAKYREIGVRYRYGAIQALRIAMRETGPGPDYRVLVMVMLCLVTIGVMSGQDDDFRVHLDAAREWRKTRSRWKLLSHSTRQLSEIGSFLSLLARTFEFRPSTASWPYNASSLEQEVIESSSCYEYMYGVTPAIAGAIHHTCHLAEHLSHFRDAEQDLSEDFLEACEGLGNKLESWQFGSESITSISREDEPRFLLLTYQAKAWHAAALIYYFHRIQGTPSEQLTQEVDCVLDNLTAAEEIKPVSDRATMAPITWPGLIASLTTPKTKRHLWADWWQKMARYRIANIDKQWVLIQRIWGVMDRDEVEGKGQRDWIEVFKELDIHLLPA